MREQQNTETIEDNGNKDTHIFIQDTSTSKTRLIILSKRNSENCKRISKIKLHINRLQSNTVNSYHNYHVILKLPYK